MVWNPSGASAIHDHARAHCVMKVKSSINEFTSLCSQPPKILKGSLKERLYETPPEGSRRPPGLVKEAQYAENQVTHISDQIGIHKISNPSATEFAVSLHLYTPPYAAHFGFHVFDEVTGEPRHMTQANLTSNRGVKLEK